MQRLLRQRNETRTIRPSQRPDSDWRESPWVQSTVDGHNKRKSSFEERLSTLLFRTLLFEWMESKAWMNVESNSHLIGSSSLCHPTEYLPVPYGKEEFISGLNIRNLVIWVRDRLQTTRVHHHHRHLIHHNVLVIVFQVEIKLLMMFAGKLWKWATSNSAWSGWMMGIWCCYSSNLIQVRD